MRVVTESGTEYRFNADRTKVRKGDGEWETLECPVTVQTGLRMVMNLSEVPEGKELRIRTTSRVLEVWA